MKFKSRYITEDEFKEYFGVDLSANIKDDDNPSATASAFLFRVETRVSAFLNANFYRNIDKEYPCFTDYQKEHYKLALLEQAMYVLKNGDISMDSGYDQDAGIKVSREQLKGITICENAKEQLVLCGMWCRKIKNRARSGLDGWWMY